MNKYINCFFKLIFITIIFYNIKKNDIINDINLSKYINNNYFIIMNKINNKNNPVLSKNNYNIENVFILIEIMPFIKNKIIIKKSKIKEIFQLIKNIFLDKRNSNIIIIDNKDYYYLVKRFNEIINYKWEIIPDLKLINQLRYIINNFYNEYCLDSFDKALNFNVNNYIKMNKTNFSSKDINNLMSKYNFYKICI